MALKQENHIIKGLQRDLSISKFNPEYAFDATNIRITAREDNTLLTVTNEKGTKEVIIQTSTGDAVAIDGTLIGYSTLNNYVILFTTGTQDNIYRLENKGNYFESLILFSGSLNFSTDYPIESLGVYENENVQKIYWVDGKNQPRVVNIKLTYSNSDKFNFVNKVNLSHIIDIEKTDSGGNFPSGVIQYAFSYYNLYGQESNIFEQTPLYYLSPKNIGLDAGTTSSAMFKITVNSLDTNFDFLRVYSIVRTSENSTPTVKIIGDFDINSSYMSFVDDGTKGESIDPTELLYIGGESIIANTFCQKDNTLFLGNITLNRKSIGELPCSGTTLSDAARSLTVQGYNKNYKEGSTSGIAGSGFYNHSIDNNRPSTRVKVFKFGETYRLGFIAQHETGKWSEVIWVKDEVNKIEPVSTNSRYYTGCFEVVLSSEIKNTLKAAGYLRVAPVVVYPQDADRTILCQGLVCPTVYNVRDRAQNTPFVQSSWFTRFYKGGNIAASTDVESRHNYSLFPSKQRNGEIQIMCNEQNSAPYKSGMDNTTFIGNYSEDFYVDQSVVTFHTPEVECSELLTQSSLNDTSFRIVGYTTLINSKSDMSLQTSTVGTDANSAFIEGLYDGDYRLNRLISNDLWVDKANTGVDLDDRDDWRFGFAIYPWHRSGSVNDQGVAKEGEKRPAMLQYKKMSNIMYCVSNYNPYGYSIDPAYGITSPQVFNTNEISAIKIPSPANSGLEPMIYYGNVDKVLVPTLSDLTKVGGINKTDGYPVYHGFNKYVGKDAGKRDKWNYYKSNLNLIGRSAYEDSYTGTSGVVFNAAGKDPVNIKYKSAPHIVFAFNYTPSGNQVVMPTGKPIVTSLIQSPFWTNRTYNVEPLSTQINSSFDGSPVNGGIFIGELYRENVPNRFGGVSPQAIANNQWLRCGNAVSIDNGVLLYLEGDSYFARYDCLKTYPFTLEDQNSVVEILSAMIETRVNLDERYDRNRAQSSNLVMTPNNFNLFNTAYQQTNNFFTYRALNYKLFNIDSFNNSITWSKEKNIGAEIDLWTNITMASTLDLDGDKGEIVSLNTYNNEIFCFQRRGLSNILFNSRIQIPSSDGVPIEITNGLKVSGKRYISNSVGCSNKWSIVETPSGLYFVDNETNSLYLFNGQLTSLSDKLGFRQWIGENNSYSDWEPVNYGNFRSFYDKNNDDVYFINSTSCLCYSELLGQFTSFMSYEKVSAMFNIGSEFYSFNKGKLWHNFAGDYNMFYGEFKPFSITVIANGDEPYDKVFNNVEFRADTYDGNTLLPNKTFDTLDVYNEYQHGRISLVNILGHPSSLKQKFRVWRANIPRANMSTNGIQGNNRDRIRNTWAYVKLSVNEPNTYRTQFHDLSIHYFI